MPREIHPIGCRCAQCLPAHPSRPRHERPLITLLIPAVIMGFSIWIALRVIARALSHILPH